MRKVELLSGTESKFTDCNITPLAGHATKMPVAYLWLRARKLCFNGWTVAANFRNGIIYHTDRAILAPTFYVHCEQAVHMPKREAEEG